MSDDETRARGAPVDAERVDHELRQLEQQAYGFDDDAYRAGWNAALADVRDRLLREPFGDGGE